MGRAPSSRRAGGRGRPPRSGGTAPRGQRQSNYCLQKYLIVNADDFGFTRDVNQGIVAAHQSGILTATTLMATGAQFEDAVRLAREHPSLDVGAHLVLVGSPGLPDSVAQLIWALGQKRIEPYAVFSAQVQRIVDAGIQPTHLDTHKHTPVSYTHLTLPTILRV